MPPFEFKHGAIGMKGGAPSEKKGVQWGTLAAPIGGTGGTIAKSMVPPFLDLIFSSKITANIGQRLQ